MKNILVFKSSKKKNRKKVFIDVLNGKYEKKLGKRFIDVLNGKYKKKFEIN